MLIVPLAGSTKRFVPSWPEKQGRRPLATVLLEAAEVGVLESSALLLALAVLLERVRRCVVAAVLDLEN